MIRLRKLVLLVATPALLALGSCSPKEEPPPPAEGVRPAPPDCPACGMGLTAEWVFKRLDADKNGTVSPAEFGKSPGIHDAAEAKEATARIDKNGDGSLSWEEFDAAYQQRHAKCTKSPTTPGQPGERGNMTRFAQVFILRSDRNHDGKVDKSEFRGGDARFDQMDRNKNGCIDPEELRELHQRRMNDPKTMRERIESGDVKKRE